VCAAGTSPFERLLDLVFIVAVTHVD